jgi:lysophospholipase L1-like esterase
MGAARSRLRVAAFVIAGALGVLVTSSIMFAGRANARGGGNVATPRYYVALGDSLATGGGATPGHSYVDDVFGFASGSIPGLVLENLGCAGDSTTRMINGGLCHNYQTGNQLGDAEAFLRAHRHQVAFVTIDIGGDDVDGCWSTGSENATCVMRGLAAIDKNLRVIMKGLRAAGGRVPIVGMNYYDTILAFYLKGAAGQQIARQSLPVLLTLNHELAHIYHHFGARVANVQRAFDSTDWRLAGSYNGQTLPVNVANICNWTHMCQPNPNVHTNDIGHAKLAAAFEAKLHAVMRRTRRLNR